MHPRCTDEILTLSRRRFSAFVHRGAPALLRLFAHAVFAHMSAINPAPPQQHPCSLLRCPDVIVQLLVQLLPRPGILRMARCCHQLLHAISSPAAFQLVPLRLRSDLGPRSQVAFGLLRFAPLSLQICKPTEAQSWVEPAFAAAAASKRKKTPRPSIPFWSRTALLALLSQTAQIVRLEFSHSSCTQIATGLWMELLARPSLRSLESLIIHRPENSRRSRCAITPQMLQLICALPRLRTLSVHPDAADPARWAALSEARLLTDLHIADSNGNDLPSLLPTVVQFAAPLRSLSILLPKLSMDQFCDVFTQSSPTCLSLQHLTLERWDVEHCPEGSDLAAAFLALRSLFSLKLLHVQPTDRVLASLHHSVSLRMLSILPILTEHCGLSAAAVGHLLVASPHLVATVYLAQHWPYTTARPRKSRAAIIQDFRDWQHAHRNEELLRRLDLSRADYA